MGSRNPDRIHITEYRHKCETVGKMYENGWKLRSRCQTCRLELELDWRMVVLVLGPHFSLWGRTARCRKIGCNGRVVFLGLPHPHAHWDVIAGRIPEPREPHWKAIERTR